MAEAVAKPAAVVCFSGEKAIEATSAAWMNPSAVWLTRRIPNRRRKSAWRSASRARPILGPAMLGIVRRRRTPLRPLSWAHLWSTPGYIWRLTRPRTRRIDGPIQGRRPAPPAAHLDRRPPPRVAGRRRDGRRQPLGLGSLLSALRRPERSPLRGVDAAGRDGRRDPGRPVRGDGDLQLLPQSRASRRHGSHGRPPLRRADGPGDRCWVVPARLRGIWLRIRHRDRPPARAASSAPSHRGAVAQARPAAHPGSAPHPDRRGRGEGHAEARGGTCAALERLRATRAVRAQERRAHAVVRGARPRPRGDRTHRPHRGRGRRGEPMRTSTPAPSMSSWRSGPKAGSPSTSRRCSGCSTRADSAGGSGVR